MDLIFERGERGAPTGHALIYFRTDDGRVLATYCAVLPIAFDFTDFLPAMFKDAMQGADIFGGGNSVVAMPPVPQEAPLDYLQALAVRRNDDLVYAGGTMAGDPMRAAAVAAEAAQKYGELYEGSSLPAQGAPAPVQEDDETQGFMEMTEEERLRELTVLTGVLRDSLRSGRTDPRIERQMEQLASYLPAKYRARQMVEAARMPGEKGQRLAELYLDRSFKLLHEDYLDLERIDREIEAAQN